MGSSISVLHVDDEPNFADLTAAFLEREDDRFSVTTATSVSEGCERLATGDYDCIVSDYEMPGRDGVEFLESVRADDPDIPFILFTGKGSEEVASEAISAGVTDYLQKEGGTDQYAVLANRITNAVEHYRSRQLVEQSQRRLRRIIDSVPHIMYVVDEDGRYLLANQTLADFHGVSVEDLEGTTVDETLEDGAVEQFRSDLKYVLETETERRLSEIEMVDADGERHVHEPRLLPYGHTETDNRAVLGISVDVTERKERERALERTRERMELALKRTDSLIFEIDCETGAVVRHGSFEDFFAVSPDDVATWTEHLDRVVHPDDRDRFRRFYRELIEGDREAGELEYRTNPELGGPRWISDSVSLRKDSESGGRQALGIARDVTDRVEREQRLRSLNETTQELMAAETREEVAEIGVTAASEILGLKINAIYFYDDERSALVPAAITEAGTELFEDPPTFTGGDSIAWRVYEDGEARAIDDIHDDSDIYNPDSPIRGELPLPIDEHGLLMAGSETPEAFDHRDVVFGEILTSNVATALEQVKRTEQLRAHKRELARQNDRLEEFASVVSHDLRNPLTLAEGRLELAIEECDTDHLEDVVQAHERMNVLIDDLLALAREGDEIQALEPVDLDALTRRCWQTVATQEATIAMDLDRTIEADRSRLRQLLENLLRNAVEHGGKDVTVTVGATDDGFYVADDGPGIPEANRDDVFETGYSTSMEGTGFGLSIVEQVVDAHDWEIRTTESADGGARFEISGVEFVADENA